jgi:transposase
VFANTDEGIRSFFAALQSRDISKDDAIIGVESTGVYHHLLSVRARDAGWPIVILNPLETFYAIKSQSLRKTKTDRRDAISIRTMVLAGRGRPFAETNESLALKALITEREGLVIMHAMVKTRREAHHTRTRAITPKLHDCSSAVTAALDHEILMLEREMRRYAPATQKLLRSIPGVGPVTAAVLVAYIGDINRFSSPEKLVAYVGLDCRVHESGTSIKGKGFISKRGNVHLRKILFNAAFIASQWNPELKAYFLKKTGEGKHYFSALCAVERKLIHLIYAVWKRGTPFKSESPKSPTYAELSGLSTSDA